MLESIPEILVPGEASPSSAKFVDPEFTASGKRRATVGLSKPTTLWFNTGSLCNIACQNCYIESSPRNDRLAYISANEVEDYLRQIAERNWPVTEIGLTGGEPFLNPQIVEILRAVLDGGFRLLVLTNAMRPMMRPRVTRGLEAIGKQYRDRIVIRVSLDHYGSEFHDEIRGKGTFSVTLKGMDWLSERGFSIAVAGRRLWNESEEDARMGFHRLFKERNYDIDAFDPSSMVLFPEMDATDDVPEITEDCWKIVHKSPSDMMCASSRMVVKRKGASVPSVLACTVIPYSRKFELGTSLADAERPVALNHPHCAQFCVLGGASCSPK